MIRVFIVDDHPVVIEGIYSLLQNEKGIEWAGQAMNAANRNTYYYYTYKKFSFYSVADFFNHD